MIVKQIYFNNNAGNANDGVSVRLYRLTLSVMLDSLVLGIFSLMLMTHDLLASLLLN